MWLWEFHVIGGPWLIAGVWWYFLLQDWVPRPGRVS